MAGIIVDEGRSKALVDTVKDAQVSLFLGLYTDASQPAKTATLSTLTEAAGTGYARITLTDTDWTEVNQVITNLEKTFTAGAGGWGNITGYFIGTTLDNTGKLIAVESFTQPLNMTDGSTLKITPKVKGADAV